MIGRYYAQVESTEVPPTLTRLDRVVDFDWKGTAPAEGLSGRSFVGVWSGYIQAKTTGLHQISVGVDTGVTVWANGRQIFDNSAFNEYPSSEGMVYLVAGQKVPINIKYTHFGGTDPFQLSWSGPGLPKEVIPVGCFYSGK